MVRRAHHKRERLPEPDADARAADAASWDMTTVTLAGIFCVLALWML